jgi:hypothetical protein
VSSSSNESNSQSRHFALSRHIVRRSDPEDWRTDHRFVGLCLSDADKLASYCHADGLKHVKLYLALASLRETFDDTQVYFAVPKNSSVARGYRGIQKSIQRLALFAKSRPGMSFLQLPPKLDAWLSEAENMLVLVSERIADLKDASGLSEFVRGGPPPVAAMAGIRLPALYERMTGSRFKISKNTEGETLDRDGVGFVIRSIIAMRLQPITAETVASHWFAMEKFRAKT